MSLHIAKSSSQQAMSTPDCDSYTELLDIHVKLAEVECLLGILYTRLREYCELNHCTCAGTALQWFEAECSMCVYIQNTHRIHTCISNKHSRMGGRAQGQDLRQNLPPRQLLLKQKPGQTVEPPDMLCAHIVAQLQAPLGSP